MRERCGPKAPMEDIEPTAEMKTSNAPRATISHVPGSAYVALLLYLWVRFGLGVGVGGCRERVVRGR